MDLNKVILIGRLTKEIELKATSNGINYIQFDLAVGNGKNKDGEEREPDFINCVAWEKRAETLSLYVHKGNRVAIEGRIKMDKYKNEQGENRYKTYVLVEGYEFLEPKQKDNFVPQEPEQTKQVEESDPYQEFGDNIEVKEEQSSLPFEDSDLPF